MDVWDLIEKDRALEEQGVPRAERERMVAKMAKTMPAEATGADRADWTRDVYPVALVKAEKVANKFYRSVEDMVAKYGDPEPGERFWMVDGKKEYASFPADAEQWNLTFEVLDGEKKTDWLFVFSSPRFWAKKDGTWGGKLAAIYLAAMPDFDLSEGIESDLSDLMHKPLRAVVEPKADAQYAKVNDWLPMSAGDRKKYADATTKPADLPVSEGDLPGGGEMPPDDGEEIPF